MEELIFRTCLFIVGIIHILPAFLIFSTDKISKSYGIEIPNKNYELILKHRAFMFWLIAGILIYSSLFQKYYEVSVIAGLASMFSFIVLYFQLKQNINLELKKIMQIDVICIFILSTTSILYFFI